MLLLGGGVEARIAFRKRVKRGIVSCCRGNNVLHVCLDGRKDVGWRLVLVLLHGCFRAAKRDTASVVRLLHALGCLVSRQEIILPGFSCLLGNGQFVPHLVVDGESLS